MSTADTYVRARIDSATKERAADALDAMGLSISDAIRLLMLRIAAEHRLPFEVKAPSASSLINFMCLPWCLVKNSVDKVSALAASELVRRFRRSRPTNADSASSVAVQAVVRLGAHAF